MFIVVTLTVHVSETIEGVFKVSGQKAGGNPSVLHDVVKGVLR